MVGDMSSKTKSHISSPLSLLRVGLALVLLPCGYGLAQLPSALLYGTGSVWVNGISVPDGVALFDGDTVQVGSNGLVKITGNGLSATASAGSIFTFERRGIHLSRGTLHVATSKALPVVIDDVDITPESGNWTDYQVSNSTTEITVSSSLGRVKVHDLLGETSVQAGQSSTVKVEHKKKKPRRPAAAGAGGIMNSTAAVEAGGVIAGAIGAWVLIQNEDPVSPDCRVKSCK